MRNQFILIFLVCVPASHLCGQQKPSTKPSTRVLEWQLKPAAGYNIPLTRLFRGDVTDQLIKYDDQSFYWQVLSLTLFFHKHWGVSFHFQANASGKISSRDERFRQLLQTEYGSDYYITHSSIDDLNKFNVVTGHFDRGYLGVIYRVESNRFFIYPQLSLGVSSFYTDIETIRLKEKTTNNRMDLYYSAGDRPAKDHFTIAASMAAGYKLNKWLYLNLDVMASWYKANFTYTKTTLDVVSRQSVQEETRYKQDMLGLSVGAGLIISLKK